MHQHSCRVIKDLSCETFENECMEDYSPNIESAPLINDNIHITVGLSCPRLLISEVLQTSISSYYWSFMILLRQTSIRQSSIRIRLYRSILNKILES